MRIRIEKWGNSLALRIPRSVAAEAALDQGALVDLEVEAGRLVVTLVSNREYTLTELLSRITRDNLHQGIDTGPAVGDEPPW